MPESKEELNIVMKAEDILKKQDFSVQFEKVLKLLIEMEKRNREAIIQLQQQYAQIMNQMQMSHTKNYTDLKKQVNTLFVEDKLKNIDSKNEITRSELKRTINGLINAKIKDVDSKISQVKDGYTPIKGKDYFDGKDAQLNLEELVNNLQGKLTLDSVKDLRGILKKIASAKPMGRTRAYGVDVIDLSGDVNGQRRIFNIPQDVDAILGASSSQFPFVLNTGDWTLGRGTFTFGSSVPTVERGQNLMVLVRTLFQR